MIIEIRQTILRKHSIWYIATIALLVTASACFSTTENSPSFHETPQFPIPQIDLVKPLRVSTEPEDVALADRLNQLIDSSEFRDSRWGVFVVSLEDGRVIAARDAQKLFTPASVQKIITSSAGLDLLGPEFRWRTRVLATKGILNGTIDGDLIVYGEGAPDLTSAVISQIANQLKEKGLRRVSGDIIGDESYFAGDSFGDGWAWNELQWYYGAGASALTVNRNETELTIEDGRPISSSNFIKVSGSLKPIRSGATDSIGVKRELGSDDTYVWGEGSTLKVRLALTNPARIAASELKKALESAGIAIEGGVRTVDWKSEPRSAAEELLSVESGTLAGIVGRMNKDSVNIYAELILRTLGKKFGDTAPETNPKLRAVRGDDAAGAAVIRKWLTDQGISLRETESVRDGSGLSRLNLVTPETIVRTLIYAAQMPGAQQFRDSLPIAGVDGTLKGRLAKTGGKIIGKTGSILQVNTLAGYANRANGETLAFGILINNVTVKADSNVLIDKLAAMLAQ
ncbi:MAG: D-alanyl-D-alanine carboxypeptidase/D-alanyl-D-alanine-endopeptidase [Pyrinomonadaceae bacterium]